MRREVDVSRNADSLCQVQPTPVRPPSEESGVAKPLRKCY